MSQYSQLAECLDSAPLKDSKHRGIEVQRDTSRRIVTPQVSTPQGNNSHDKLVSSQLFDLPAIDPKVSQLKPWKTDSKYFNKCMISSLALMKMTTHAQNGGSIEIMGMLIGKIIDRKIVVMDTYRLPVEGTETRVNAQGEAYEYMVQYLELNQKISDGNKPRQENIVGWYHSHPGYGCWLSGIDVSTQELNQNFQDPYLAIVVDPVRTLKLGKVDIGAFRTLPASFTEGELHESASKAALQNLPKSKRQEFGSHASRYYALDVEIFENEHDAEMLKLMQKQESVDYEGLVKKISVDEGESIKAVREDANLSSLQYFENFDFVGGDDETVALKEIIKRLEGLKSPPGESPASLFLKKIINASKIETEGAKTRSMSRRREVNYEDEDVLDESDLERVYTGEDKLGAETEGEDWDDEQDDENSDKEQEAQEEVQDAPMDVAQDAAQEIEVEPIEGATEDTQHDSVAEAVAQNVSSQEVARDSNQELAHDDEQTTNIFDASELQEAKSEETPTSLDTREPGTRDTTMEKSPSRNQPSSIAKRSIRKKLRTRKDDLGDFLYDPSLAGVQHKLKRKQKPLPRPPMGLSRYAPDEYIRQVEFLDLHRKLQQQSRWAREKGLGEQQQQHNQARYFMASSSSSSMGLDMREKNRLVVEASRALAAKNVCDLITMEAMKKMKEGGE